VEYRRAKPSFLFLSTGTSLTNADTPLLSIPLSYVRTGEYDYARNKLSQAYFEPLWTLNPHVSGRAFYYYHSQNYFQPSGGNYQGNGSSLRCLPSLFLFLKNHINPNPKKNNPNSPNNKCSDIGILPLNDKFLCFIRIIENRQCFINTINRRI